MEGLEHFNKNEFTRDVLELKNNKKFCEKELQRIRNKMEIIILKIEKEDFEEDKEKLKNTLEFLINEEKDWQRRLDEVSKKLGALN